MKEKNVNRILWPVALAILGIIAAAIPAASEDSIYPPNDGKSDGVFNISDYAALTNGAPLPDGIVAMGTDGNAIIIITRSAIPVEIAAGTVIFQQGAIKTFPDNLILTNQEPTTIIPDRSLKYGMITLRCNDYMITGFNRVLKIGG